MLDIVLREGGDPAQIVEKRGLRQVTDTGAIEAAIDAVIAANPDKVTDAKANPKAIGWFVKKTIPDLRQYASKVADVHGDRHPGHLPSAKLTMKYARKCHHT